METLPQLSIVICTYNRARFLEDTLRTVFDQDGDGDLFEVVLVDNNSSDDTPAITRDFMERRGTGLRYVHEERQGLSHARNRGAREARGALIAFIDDDVFVDRKYVSAIIGYFDRHPEVDAVGGRIEVHYEDGAPAWISPRLAPLLGEHMIRQTPGPYPPNRYPLGGNMCFRRETLLASPGFDPALGRTAGLLLASEEKDLFHRLRRDGARIHHLPDALIHHRVDAARLGDDYVRRQALGIGLSERSRTRAGGRRAVAEKVGSEVIKAGGTAVLAIAALLRGRREAASMLVRFRWWVWKGLLGRTPAR